MITIKNILLIKSLIMKKCLINLGTDKEEIINSIDYNSFKYREKAYMPKPFKLKKIISLEVGWLIETNIERDFIILGVTYELDTKKFGAIFSGGLFSFDYILNTKSEICKNVQKQLKRYIAINNILNN